MNNSQFFRKEDINEILYFVDNEYKKFNDKTILLTGGRGFLGRYFTEFFLSINKKLKKPCKIISIDNMITSGTLGSILENDKNLKFYKKDICKKIIINEKIDFMTFPCKTMGKIVDDIGLII